MQETQEAAAAAAPAEEAPAPVTSEVIAPRELVIIPARHYARRLDDHVLLNGCAEVAEFGAPLRRLVDEMFATLEATEQGVGLAAPQVGEAVRVIVINIGPKAEDATRAEQVRLALVNPVITESSDETHTVTEGCLSIPHVYFPVTRSSEVVVRARAVHGEEVAWRARGFAATVLQHEIDHLDGVLFTDRMSRSLKDRLAKRVRRVRENGHWK